MMWFGLAKMALRTGAEVYKNRQESKILNSLAEKKHLERVDLIFISKEVMMN